MPKQRVVLVIVDGWGIGPDYNGNAIKKASTPTLDSLWSSFPHTELQAAGEAVGLPKGEDGNTETGHLNIGAGKVVYQDLPRINMAIANGGYFENKAFLSALAHVTKHHSNLHLLGLIGQGGVHSSNDHLYALLRLCKQRQISQVYLHLITDGRDSAPTSSPQYLAEVQQITQDLGVGQIATVLGRYFAMDRDHRWERIKVAYDALVSSVGQASSDYLADIAAKHAAGETDEFIKPLFPLHNGAVLPRVKSNDALIFFNYRIDRPRELTKALVLDDAAFSTHTDSFDPYAIKYNRSHLTKTISDKAFPRPDRPLDLFFVSMTEYEKNLPVEIAFPPEFVEMPLSRIVALSGRRQLKLAESEKERFVTYYFNGQRELRFPGEDVQITPSPRVATYDLQPEMSAELQTEKLIAAINSDIHDLIVINYANPDMVAHTGNFEATVKACEFVDKCLRRVYQAVILHPNVTLLITADHGNAEELVSLENGGVDTEHSRFPVPLFIVGQQFRNNSAQLPRGILGDVAPTILKILGLSKPSSMSGRSLI